MNAMTTAHFKFLIPNRQRNQNGDRENFYGWSDTTYIEVGGKLCLSINASVHALVSL